MYLHFCYIYNVQSTRCRVYYMCKEETVMNRNTTSPLHDICIAKGAMTYEIQSK